MTDTKPSYVMDGGPHSLVYEWIAETVVTLSSRFQALGMEPLANADGDDLTRQLREEALQKRGVALGPMMIGAFARRRIAPLN